MKFIGRAHELQELERLYHSEKAQLAVVHGRRRVGKSTLVEHFVQNKTHISLEGLEGVHTKGQLKQIKKILMTVIDDSVLRSIQFDDWTTLLDYLTGYFEKQQNKTILFLDEFQWMAAGQSKLVSIIKFYWDRFWSKQKVMLILCGSVSSFMIKRVIHSKALYGRINWELCLQPLLPVEVYQLLDGKRSKDEVLLYSLLLGGIPKYLQEIDPNRSFEQNVNRLFFIKNAIFANEYSRIFFSQFKEYKKYEAIIIALKSRPLSLNEIAKAIKQLSGGGVKVYLKNLEQASFITSYTPFDKGINSKLIRYKLTDEYLRFYFKFISPNIKLINNNISRNLFNQIVKSQWLPWLGFAFENFCFKNALYLAELMGFSGQVLQWGPLFHQEDTCFQIDLIYLRQDNVITVCEIKYQNEPIGIEVIQEMERKCDLISLPRGFTLEKALISRFGADASLQKLKYFHHDIKVDDFFS